MLAAWETWLSEREDQPSFLTMEEKSDEGKVVFALPDGAEFVVKGPGQTGEENIEWLFEACDANRACMNPEDQEQWILEVNEEISYSDESEAASVIFEVVTKKYEKIYEGIDSDAGWDDDHEDPSFDRVDSEDKANLIMSSLPLRDTYILQNKETGKLGRSLGMSHELE